MSGTGFSDRDELELDPLMRTLLEPRLGHAPTPWPSALRAALLHLARERGMSPHGLLSALVVRPDARAIDMLVSAGTIPHTQFMRHPEHFEHLSQMLSSRGKRRTRIWSAGCATGEEAYSIALTAERLGASVDVLATDVSAAAIAFARAGRYPRGAVMRAGLPVPEQGDWIAPESLKSRIRFRRTSLIDEDPTGGNEMFEVAFCRNVLIYFSREMAERVLHKIAAHVETRGSMVVAPVEALVTLPPGVSHSGPLGWLTRNLRPPSAYPPPPPRTAPSYTGAPSAPRATKPPPRPTAPRISSLPPPPFSLDEAARALGRGWLEEAERHLRDAIVRAPNEPEAWFLLGETLERRGEPTQARIAFTEAAQRASATPTGETLAEAARRRAANLRTG